VFYSANTFWAWVIILLGSCCAWCCLAHCVLIPCCTCMKRENKFDKSLFYRRTGPSRIYSAHRGGGEERVENTLAAFKHAYDEGINFMELDLGMTKDGKVIIIHDEDLERMCGEKYAGKLP